MRYRYLDDFRRGISVFAIFSYGIAVLGTPQCPPPIVTNVNFLPKISIQCKGIRLWELIKWSPKGKCLDLLSNSLNSFTKEMYGDQFGESVCGYWGLKG